MTVTPTRDAATVSSSEAVAGLHLAVTRERDVEHDLLHLADALVRNGVPVTWLTTHRTVTELGASCSAAVAAPTDPNLLTGYLDALARDQAGSVDVLGTGRSDSDADDRARQAAAARAARTEGRAVWFPGHDDVGEEITVGDLLATTAIDVVQAMGGVDASDDVVVQTRGFLRPRFAAGRLVLHVQASRGGVLVPFEVPNPTPCCVDHA
ncbi:hypothetical protein ACXR2U_17810 [Jatrophihabitans sp. YIM 134969]